MERTVVDRLANALYQAHMKAQGAYSLTWDDLPDNRKAVWRQTADAYLDIDLRRLPVIEPWQIVEHRTERRQLSRLPLRERLAARKAG